MDHEAHLREAIQLARDSVREGGGPFGALVVHAGDVVGRGKNLVVPQRDPSAHAEIVAIRNAARRLGTHDLSGCELYASCEPCPMCLGAILWARVQGVHYAATRADAAAVGFDDERFYAELALEPAARGLPFARALAGEGLAPLAEWARKPDRTSY